MSYKMKELRAASLLLLIMMCRGAELTSVGMVGSGGLKVLFWTK